MKQHEHPLIAWSTRHCVYCGVTHQRKRPLSAGQRNRSGRLRLVPKHNETGSVLDVEAEGVVLAQAWMEMTR